MLRHLKNLTRHSAIYTISTFIQRAQGLIMLPIYTDISFIASRSAYGDYVIVYTFIAFMNVVYLYGVDAAFLRYYFLGRFERKDIYRSAIQVLSVTALLTSVIVYFAAEPLAGIIFNADGYTFFIKIAAGILFFDTLCNLPYLILRAEERSIAFASLRTGRFILELLLNVYFVIILKTGVKGILYANLTAAIINLIVLIPYQWKYMSGVFRMSAVKELLSFGLPMLPNGIAYLVVELSDRYLMTHLLDKDTLGIYGANYKFGTVMLLVVTAFRTAWQPFFLKISQEEQAKKVYARVMTYFILGAAFIVVSGSLTVEYIVKLPYAPGRSILGEAYWPGIPIIPIILTSYLLYGIYVNLTVGIYIKHKSKWMFIFTGLAALTNIGSNFYLMPAYGKMGAAIATLLAYLVMVISIFVANQKIYKIKFEYLRLSFVLAYLSMVLLIFYFANPGILFRAILILALPLLCLNPIFLLPEEMAAIKRFLQKKTA